MSKVIIAEKPSVAKNIADAVGAKKRLDGYFAGEGYYVTWAFGHLLELYDSKEYDPQMSSWRMENYPFIPDQFKYKVKSVQGNRDVVDPGAQKQIGIIKGLIDQPDVAGIISACDYDREGQIIGDIILDYLEVEKPVERLLLNEWTPDEVSEGLEKLISNDKMLPLKDAGISRQWADWIIGINLTSVATLKYQRGGGKALNVGRVLLPTLKIIYDRDKEIESFVPEEYHRLKVMFRTARGELYEALYTDGKLDKFEDKKLLEGIRDQVKGKEGIITEKASELKRSYPPYLFNLSGLQGHVTSKFKGWTSDKVLKIAQNLYEKKHITYPRTASLALEETLVPKAKKVLEVVKQGKPYADQVAFHTSNRVFNNAKVESHSAIIPTYVIPKKLTGDERIVYEAVVNRFIMQFMPVAEHEEVRITTSVEADANAHAFVSKGKIQLVEGWRVVEDIKTKDVILPKMEEGERAAVDKLKLETKGTKPPKHHTEKTLLRVMETCGKNFKNQDDEEMISMILSGFSIGTPATRAETISKLKYVGYIKSSGKSLVATAMGKRMVEMFPIKELFDLEYTGKLEKNLFDIGKSTFEQSEFLDQIYGFTRMSVEKIKNDAFHVINDLGEESQNARGEALGKCPQCGSDVVEGEKGYGCTNWRGGCKFILWKNDKFLAALGVRMTKGTVQKLLDQGWVFGSGLKSKKGSTFSAYLSYEKNKDNDYFSWKMAFDKPLPSKEETEA